MSLTWALRISCGRTALRGVLPLEAEEQSDLLRAAAITAGRVLRQSCHVAVRLVICNESWRDCHSSCTVGGTGASVVISQQQSMIDLLR